MPYTLGFPDTATKLFKFDKHVTIRREFLYADADEYQTNADRFLGSELKVMLKSQSNYFDILNCNAK